MACLPGEEVYVSGESLEKLLLRLFADRDLDLVAQEVVILHQALFSQDLNNS